MERLLIKGARVIDPSQELDLNFDRKLDVFIQNGKITGMAPNVTADDAEVIDAEGLILCPGFVDLHVHLRDPGQTHKEDIISGSEAAAAGGVTSLVCMANTNPVCDNEKIIEEIIAKAKNAKAKVYPVSSITKGMLGGEFVDFEKVQRAGAIALSEDGRYVESAAMMLEAMKKANALGLPILTHSEDLSLSSKEYAGLMNLGTVSKAIGVRGIDRAAEDVATAREIALSAATNIPVHICHVSTKGSVEMIRDARKRGVPVTGETAPHYFTLTDEELRTKNADFRMSPPLRTREDLNAVICGIADGTISAIATDHAPHSPEEKADFDKAPNGICGLETSFALGNTKLVKEGIISIYKLISLMSTSPAKIIGLDDRAGSLKLGYPADIALLDLDEKWTFDKTKMKSRSRNTPFDKTELVGKVIYTVLDGKVVYKSED